MTKTKSRLYVALFLILYFTTMGIAGNEDYEMAKADTVGGE